MSAKSEQLEGAEDEVCASCGTAAVDDTKLKICDDDCDLVKYCGDGCQENHKDLFTQPDSSHRGECPICSLPLSIDASKSTMMSCCCKLICKGCNYANKKREIEGGLEPRCAFCREPAPKSMGEIYKNIKKRIKKKDPAAMVQMGKRHDNEGDYGKALTYYTKAIELGDAEAHACLGTLYYEGKGVEEDMAKAIHHLEQAAIGGHPNARWLLAKYEAKNGRIERAAKHSIIAANLGCNISLQSVKKLFVAGIVSKEDYAAALRGYQSGCCGCNKKC